MSVTRVNKYNFSPAQLERLSGLKVLIAEDDPLNVLLVQKILSGLNIDVSVARNGLIAVDMVRNDIFDVVLMDIQMPELDGVSASLEILKLNPALPIVIISSNVPENSFQTLEKAGVTDFLSKPFPPAHLLQMLINRASKNEDEYE